jgi:hypothetical protein
MTWNLDDVLLDVEQLEKCPVGAFGDEIYEKLNKFLNANPVGTPFRKANSELCKRTQMAVVDYQKKKSANG